MLSPYLTAFLILEVWNQVGVEVLVPKGETHPQRENNDSTEREANFRLLVPLTDREQDVVGIARMMNPMDGKYGCCYIARTRDGHGRFLVCFLYCHV